MKEHANHDHHRRIRSQKARILEHMRAGYRLTPRQAVDLCGSMKLATRISELINQDGHTEIQKEWVWAMAEGGEMIRVMSYYIPADKRGIKAAGQNRITEKK